MDHENEKEMTREEIDQFEEQVFHEEAAKIFGKSALADEPTDEPTAEVEPVDEDESGGSDNTEDAGVADDNAAAAEKVLFDKLTAKLDSIEFRLKQNERRTGAVQNTIRDTLKQQGVKKASKEVKSAPTPSREEIEAAAKSDVRFDQARKDYAELDDLLDVIEERIAVKQASNRPGVDIDSVISTVTDTVTGKLSDRDLEIQVDLVDLLRPGWRSRTQANPDYHDWVKGIPQDDAALGYSNYAKDAVKIIDMYDAYVAEQQEASKEEKTPEQVEMERKARLSRSQQAKDPSGTAKRKRIEDMTDEEYELHLLANPKLI
jgi:hypothetical protein